MYFFKPLNILTCILIIPPQPDTLPLVGTFASMIGHYSKLAKRSPIPSLGAVSEACSVNFTLLSLQTVIILWCLDIPAVRCTNGSGTSGGVQPS